MSEQFKAGDTVQLKSGGPLMTVKVGDLEECYCEWFGTGQTLQGKNFYHTSLKKADAPSEASLADAIAKGRARVAAAAKGK
jgi:uncharacterized protein YodC (DUF2158 family)